MSLIISSPAQKRTVHPSRVSEPVLSLTKEGTVRVREMIARFSVLLSLPKYELVEAFLTFFGRQKKPSDLESRDCLKFRFVTDCSPGEIAKIVVSAPEASALVSFVY